jgi:hypothetical protein
MLYLLKEYATSTATVSGCKTTVSWNSKDVSAMKYEIERTVAGQTVFVKVGEVTGSGTVFSNQTHTFEDDLSDVPKGTVTYRIRQVIDTSASGFMADYIDTVSTSLATSCLSGSNSIELAPNPARGSLNVKVNTQTAITNLVIKVYNSLGQMVVDLKRSKAEGSVVFNVPVFKLPGGKYYVSVYDGKNLIETKELLKL